MRNILIGTGFYASYDDLSQKLELLNIWIRNAPQLTEVVIVDNGQTAVMEPRTELGRYLKRYVRIYNNLGHNCDDSKRGSKLMGWSMSWIIPAMIAYSEDCDFIYKEQDCLAFGDWVPIVRGSGLRLAYGRPEAGFPCEQSLFYMERDFIPEYIAFYMAIKEPDYEILAEFKMVMAAQQISGCGFHDLPGGRIRYSLPETGAWYGQKFTAPELEELKRRGMI